MNRRTEWNSKIAQTPPTVEYKGIMAENGQGETGVLSVLDKVVSRIYLRCGSANHQHEFGFCFISGIPATPEDTETLIRRIAPIRDTHCKLSLIIMAIGADC